MMSIEYDEGYRDGESNSADRIAKLEGFVERLMDAIYMPGSWIPLGVAERIVEMAVVSGIGTLDEHQRFALRNN